MSRRPEPSHPDRSCLPPHPVNTGKSSFYSWLFKEDSFLRPKPDGVYAHHGYLESQGFTPDLDLTGKTVVELGAGTGRLCLALHQQGQLEKAASYIVVEPSSGIDYIRRGSCKNGNYS